MEFPFPQEGYSWQPVSKIAVTGWLVFYAIAMYLYLPGHYPFLDAAHLVTHEAGHLVMGFTGNMTIIVMAGTFWELMVPLLLAGSFAWRGHTTGTAFCLWGFFNAFLGVGIYMADARDKALPLVSGMASDEITEHDCEYIFNWFGVITHDRQIGAITGFLGWIGMFAVVAWLVYMWRRTEQGAY